MEVYILADMQQAVKGGDSSKVATCVEGIYNIREEQGKYINTDEGGSPACKGYR